MGDHTKSLIAQQAEHCHQCYRLIRSGEMYHETDEGTAICGQCGDINQS